MRTKRSARWWLTFGCLIVAGLQVAVSGYLLLHPPGFPPQASASTSASDLELGLRYLQRQDSGFDKLYARTWPVLPGIVRDYLPRPVPAVSDRIAAATYLGKMGSAAAPAVPALLKAINDPAMHRTAETALLSIAADSLKDGDPGWVAPFVLSVLTDTKRAAWSDEIRQAAQLVSVLRLTNQPYLDALCRFAESGDQMTQMESVNALGTLGNDLVRNGKPIPENVIESLGVALESGNEMVRRDALQALGTIGAKSVLVEARILEALGRESSPTVLWQLVEAAMRMKVDSEKLAAVLEGVMKNPPVSPPSVVVRPTISTPGLFPRSAGVDLAAAQHLWRVSPTAARRNLSFYLDHLNDHPGLWVALGEMKPAPSDAIPKLTARIASTSDEWISSLADTIWKISPENEEAIPRLHQIVEGSNSRAKNPAAFTLWKIRGETNLALRVLIESLTDRTNRTSAAHFLGEMGSAAREAIPLLRGMIQDTNSFVRTSAAFALWKINGETNQLIRMLTDGLTHSSPSDFIDSAQLFGRMGAAAQDAIPALRRFANVNPNWRTVADQAIDKIEADLREKRGK